MGNPRDRPAASSEMVRARMSRQRTADTKPEAALRSALHRRGVRFRLHRRDLPGRPDIIVVRARLAIFVDGCFWHACPIHYVPPRANAEWWASKLSANVERDRRVDAALLTLGWRPMHVWEHQDPESVAAGIAFLWQASKQRSSGEPPHQDTAGVLADRQISASGHEPHDAIG